MQLYNEVCIHEKCTKYLASVPGQEYCHLNYRHNIYWWLAGQLYTTTISLISTKAWQLSKHCASGIHLQITLIGYSHLCYCTSCISICVCTYLYTGKAILLRNPICCLGTKALSRSIMGTGVTPSAFSCMKYMADSDSYKITSQNKYERKRWSQRGRRSLRKELPTKSPWVKNSL